MCDDLHWQDATELARRVRDREISASALLEHFLDRIDRYNPVLNCIVAIDREAARNRAKDADEALAAGEHWGPLHGVPITIKDTIEVVGFPCTAGVEMLKDHRPERTAAAAQNLIDAGAIVIGKTNVPPFASDLQTRNTLHGITGNAWDPERLAGGSSGGSAVALAAGLTGLELGSDIGGSSRNPAHYNSVFGMRPTWGMISGVGHIPSMPGSLAIDEFGSFGPMAKSARDLRLAFDIVRGSDPIFGHVLKPDLPEPDFDSVSDFRVAVWIDNEVVAVDNSVRKVLEDAIVTLKGAGLTNVTVAHPDFNVREGYELYCRMGGAITGTGVPEAERETMRERVRDAREKGLKHDREITRIEGVIATFSEFYADSQARGRQRVKWAEFFEQFDVLLTPSMSVAALPHGENFFGREIEINGDPSIGGDQLFWSAFQVVANLPSVVFPAGFTKEGLPVGFQVTAPHNHDYRAIRAAELFAEAIGAHRAHPSLQF